MTPPDEFDWQAQSKAIRSARITWACIADALAVIGVAVWSATH
jgi:hypothetical protein